MRKYWLVRNGQPANDDWYKLYWGIIPPVKRGGKWTQPRHRKGGCLCTFCPRPFVKVTGIFLRRGKCVEVQIGFLDNGFVFKVIG